MSELDFFGWNALLEDEKRKAYYLPLLRAVDAAYSGETPVYPPRERLFEALRLTSPERVRCVILGQDPYHEPGQAMGLSFSVPEGTKLPPSLRNIYKELADDLGITRSSGDLTPWAEQGVLLLNTVLTVEAGRAGSHRGLGWQSITDAILACCAALPQSVAFLLWGADAQKKVALIPPKADKLVLQSAHPSPLSAYRGFFGSRPFSRVNAFLAANGSPAVDWGRERGEAEP